MANAYYNSAGKEVVDGDIAYADDLNAINTAVNAGLNLVETDIQTIETNQPYYTNLAQKWATEVEDTQVTTGKYSSLHYAAKASASATTTSGYVSTVITKAGEASASAVSAAGSAGTATTKAGEASASAISASSSAGTATTKAGEASNSAIAAAASVSSINKDGSGGVAGLTLFKLNMRNVLNTFTSFFTNSNTASRTYTLPDKDGTVATTSDIDSLKLTDNITVTVGGGGQYSTINAALAYLTSSYPIYKSGGGITATISLLTGFVMAEQVIVNGLDLGWITITSVDATVTITRSALTVAIGVIYPAFAVTNGGNLPVIGALFVIDSTGLAGNVAGLMAIRAGSSLTILPAKGVTGAAVYGIYASSGAVINADSANVSNITNGYGIVAYNGSIIHAQSADAHGAGGYGIAAYYGSTINAMAANAQKGGSPSVTDFVVGSGGVIVKHFGTGGVSKTINTLTTDGIIYG